ncbi:hypothetical protein Dimus_002620 [Dionaea muscipula]
MMMTHHLLPHQSHLSIPLSSYPMKYFPSSNPNRVSMIQFQSLYLPHPPQISAPAAIRCMANPRRVRMVAKQIMRELSDMLLTDKNLQCAVLPETALGADDYLSSVATISDVEVSANLQVVKVYVSIFGDARGRDVALSGLKAKSKYVRSQLGRRMKLRLTPEIYFLEDESIEQGSRVIAILDRIKSEEKMNAVIHKEDESDDDEIREDDQEDEDIIYVR